jgi:hypothetical protein
MLFYNSKQIIILISYFSHRKIRSCLNSLFNFFPNYSVLVVDNNPSKFDNEFRKNSFVNAKSYDRILQWSIECERERDWLKSHSNIQTIQTPERLNHGDAINMALKWCLKNHFGKMVHIEPDCTVFGRNWFYNLNDAIDSGYWVAGGVRCACGSLHITPTMWDIRKKNDLNFIAQKRDLASINIEICDSSKNIGWNKIGWDTGQKAWYDCAKENKAIQVNCSDFVHHWGQSSSSLESNKWL